MSSRRIRARLFAVLAIVPACANDSSTAPPTNVDRVIVAPASVQLKVGEHAQLSAIVDDSSGTPIAGRQIHWTVRDPKIATVSTDGVVTALAVGKTQIAASAGGASGVASVQVVTPNAASLGVVPTAATVVRGKTVQLRATPRDAQGNALAGRTVTWSTSDARVATVDGSGLVRARRGGVATITATCDGKTATAVIAVAD